MRAVDRVDYRAGIDYLCVNGDTMNDKLHQLYGQIQDKKERIESLVYKLTELEKPESDCEAQLRLVINNRVRGTCYFYLTKSQTQMILKEEISDRALELAELEKQYAAMQ